MNNQAAETQKCETTFFLMKKEKRAACGHWSPPSRPTFLRPRLFATR